MFKGVFIFTALLFITVCNAVAQQSSQIALPSFHTIDTKGNVQLVVVPSDSLSSMTVELYGISGDGFDYEVRKGVLYIDVPTGIFAPAGHIKVYAATPSLNTIRIQGAEVECIGPITAEKFTLETYGTTNSVNLMVDVKRLDVAIGGHSDVTIGGKCDNAILKASLGSRIDALGLVTRTVDARAYEGSEIYVIADELISAKAATSGTVYYQGTATIVPEVYLWGEVQRIERVNGYVPLEPRKLTTQQ